MQLNFNNDENKLDLSMMGIIKKDQVGHKTIMDMHGNHGAGGGAGPNNKISQ